MLDSDLPSKMFSGVRFTLIGFNSVDGNTLRSKLLSGGGVDVGQFTQNSTHLIVDQLVYDDPICVAARANGKVVVTGSWVHHSFDIGMRIDSNSVLYRPVKDLGGIPGFKSFVVCLTGYQRQDREDIMTMVGLMGGQFLKPLVAHKVTHLICYKFEGDKYELAKRMKKIKVVNHRWLEDCLKNWKVLPEADYEISGYELEMMETAAKDSEDEAEDATVKHANNSPLGLRVSAVATVEIPKSEGKDISVGQTNVGAQEGSSFGNTSKDNWLTPKKTNGSLEPTTVTDASAAQQHNYQSANTFQDASNFASPTRVNKSPEQGMRRMESDNSTSVNRTIRRHSSLATYSRKTLSEMPDDMGLKASTPLNISAFKPGSSLERTTLFEDLDKIDKLHGGESPLTLPRAKFTDEFVSSKGSEKVHHNSEATTPPPASLLLQELRRVSPNKNLRPVPGNNEATESGEAGHISTASVLNCAQHELPERSSTKPMTENILLQEPKSGSPKQNRRDEPNTNDNTEGKKVAHTLDVSVSATRLHKSSVVPMEADIWTPENITLKGALDEVAEGSVTKPVMKGSSTSPGLGLTGTKDQQETEQPKKKTALRKSLGTRGRKKNPTNQKGSIFLREPTPKDERTDCLNNAEVSVPVTDNGNQKEMSSPVLNTEAVPEMAEHVHSETEAFKGIDSAHNKYDASKEENHVVQDLTANQDKLHVKTPEEADAEVEIRMPEPELNDVPTKDPSEGALQPEVDGNMGKRKRGSKKNLQSGKKESSSTAVDGKSSVKKTKKSRKELDAKANVTVMKDVGDNSVKEKENLALDNKSGTVSSDGDQSPVAGETLARKEAATKDPSEASVPLQVGKKKGKRRNGATVEKNRLENEKNESSCTVEVNVKRTKKPKKATDAVMKDIGDNSTEEEENTAVNNKSGKLGSGGDQCPASGKPLARKNESSCTVEVSVKKAKKPKKATDAVMKDIGDNSTEEEENIAENNKSGTLDSGGDQCPASGKPLARKNVAKSAKTGTKTNKESKQLNGKPLASRKVLQDQKEEQKFFIVSGLRPQRKEYQQIIKRLKGRCCLDNHKWSYQATHFITPEIRRTEKFFAAAASGSWILKTDYVADSKEAGKLLPEEPYEWYGTGLSADGVINLESARKWRLVKEQTGHGALYGIRIVIYGDCAIPSLDTLKRAVKAGDGTIVATAPPYTRFLNENTDFALISPAIPRDDFWIQEFIEHEIPCVLADYLVEYVCKPGYALDKHVLYNTNSWAERSFNKMQANANVSEVN